MREACVLEHRLSGRRMRVFTEEPCVQFYSALFLDCVGKGGHHYGKHHGLCLETHGFINAVNTPHFPSVILRPDQVYHTTTKWKFEVM